MSTIFLFFGKYFFIFGDGGDALRPGLLEQVRLPAGLEGTPDWLFSEGGVTPVFTKDTNDNDPGQRNCGKPARMGSPADDRYRDHWSDLVVDLAAHVRTNAAWWQSLHQLKLGGLNNVSEEAKLPKACLDERPRDGVLDTIAAIGLPYMASAFGIFLLRQTFKTVPKELDEAARVEGSGTLGTLWRVYVPLARPVYVAYALVSVSYHWNNFLWPLIVTNSVTSRPLTVGLQVFSSTDQGIDWSIITAATLLTSGPLLVAFLVFQRQFVQSFMRAGIR